MPKRGIVSMSGKDARLDMIFGMPANRRWSRHGFSADSGRFSSIVFSARVCRLNEQNTDVIRLLYVCERVGNECIEFEET